MKHGNVYPKPKKKTMKSRKITAEEAAQLSLVPFGKKHPVRILLESLENGEIAYISREEFRWKHHTPSFFLKELSKREARKFTIKNETGRGGWVVERVK